MTKLYDIKETYSYKAFEIAKEGIANISTLSADFRVQDDALRQMVEVMTNDEGICPEWNKIAEKNPEWAMELAGAMAFKVVEDRNWTDGSALSWRKWEDIAETHTIQEVIEFGYLNIPDEDLEELDLEASASTIDNTADWVNWEIIDGYVMEDINQDGFIEVAENYYAVAKSDLSAALPALMDAVDYGRHRDYCDNHSHSMNGGPTEVMEAIEDGDYSTFNLGEPEWHTNPAYVLDALNADSFTWKSAVHFQYENPDLAALYEEKGIDALKVELQERLCASDIEALKCVKEYGRAICYLPEEWQNDAEFCREAVIQNVDNFRILPEAMQHNIAVCEETAYQLCVQSSGHDFDLMPEEMHKYTSVNIAALEGNTGAWRKMDESMKAVPEVRQAALQAIFREYEADDYIDLTLLGDEQFSVAKDFKQLLHENEGLVTYDNIEQVSQAIQSKEDFLRGPEDMKMLINSLSVEIEAFELPADLLAECSSENTDYETALTHAQQASQAQKEQDRDR